MGTTSACAENTPPTKSVRGIIWNYLRVRGEYFTAFTQAGSWRELPPRARRILSFLINAFLQYGTTSACAENTTKPPRKRLVWRNYLRVRGEYTKKPEKTSFTVELPPRARRIQQNGDALKQIEGTTSACAENTLNELGLL